MKRLLMVVSLLVFGAFPLKSFADSVNFGPMDDYQQIDNPGGINTDFSYCGDKVKDTDEDCDDGVGGTCPDDCKVTFVYNPTPPDDADPPPTVEEPKNEVPVSNNPAENTVALNPNFEGSGCTLGGLALNGGPADLWILLVAALPLWLKRNKKK